MAEYLSVEEFIKKGDCGVPIVDVRSESEYAHAHIPNALSLPLFDDQQRACVGTIYKKQGRVQAIQKGLEFVGPKLKMFSKYALDLNSDTLLIHCWRGGMRSSSMAWLFETLGLKCYLLDGGYKSYRNFVLDSFKNKYKLLVLGGCTGSGKTDILSSLSNAGEQIIDLEGLANHKGSAFGAIGQEEQPSSEMFEHLVFDKLRTMDVERTLWVEDESMNVGRVFVPKSFWDQMSLSPLIKIDTPSDIRLKRILRDYACFDPDLLIQSIKKIEKRIGFDRASKAIDACKCGDIKGGASICLEYYDKLYNGSLDKRFEERDNCFVFKVETIEVEEIILDLIKLSRNIK